MIKRTYAAMPMSPVPGGIEPAPADVLTTGTEVKGTSAGGAPIFPTPQTDGAAGVALKPLDEELAQPNQAYWLNGFVIRPAGATLLIERADVRPMDALKLRHGIQFLVGDSQKSLVVFVALAAGEEQEPDPAGRPEDAPAAQSDPLGESEAPDTDTTAEPGDQGGTSA